MKTHYQVMLVDDETAGLELMEALLLPYKAAFQVCAKCHSVSEAKAALLSCTPDLIFLDIQMPEDDGFDLVKDFRNLGVVIPFVFITAYEKYMPKAFKVQPLDYLMKPVDKGELAEMLLRFKKMQKKKHETDFILPQGILTDKGLEFIRPEDIVYVKKEERKSYIYLYDGSYTTTRSSLKDIVKVLPANSFCQIHKSIVINLRYVSNFSQPQIYINMSQRCIALDIGRSFVENLKAKLQI